AYLGEAGIEGLYKKAVGDAAKVAAIEAAAAGGDHDAARAALNDFSAARFAATNADREAGWDKEAGARVAKRRDFAKDLLRKKVLPRFYARSLADYEAELAHTEPFVRTLRRLVRRFHELYTEVKRREGLIDFGDFEHFALEILSDEGVAAEYRAALRYIFIDEYQDSSPIQEALIERVRGEDNVFYVGDVKQSIYSFRNANPQQFIDKYDAFPPSGEDVPPKALAALPGKDVRIDLSNNFRSKRGIVAAVNAVFARVMDKQSAGIDYDERAQLVLGLEYEPRWDTKPVLHLVETAGDEDVREVVSEAEAEAAFAARLIAETVGQPFFDTGTQTERPYRLSDIVVLLRDAKSDASLFRRVLEEHGIPAVTDRGEGYFETVEIDAFLGLLSAIDNPRQDVPLAAALRAPVFDFSLSDFADIRIQSREGAFYAAFYGYSNNGADAGLRARCAAAIRQMARWRDEERFMRLDDFLWKLMRESGHYERAGAMLRGAQRQANLRALLDRAADYQAGRVRGLYGFLAHLAELRERARVPQAPLAADGQDVVRILTIHGSKGLEFPMVILCRLGKRLEKTGHEGKLAMHREVGLALEWVDFEAHTRKRTLLHEVVKARKARDERAESIRLLYVAMTRAMDRLHMVGAVKDAEAARALYEGADAFADADVRMAGSYLDMLLPVACGGGAKIEVAVERGTGSVAERHAAAPARRSSTPTIPDAPSPAEARSGSDTPLDDEWVYPYAAAASLRSKYSVTQIAAGLARIGETGGDGLAPTGPRFFREDSADALLEDAGARGDLSAAERGVALHRALELLDFRVAYEHRADADWFAAFVSALAENGVLSKEEAASVPTASLMRFAASVLGERAATAPLCLKELPFNMKMPASEAPAVCEGAAADLTGEEIVVQGVIDLLLRDADGRLVVVDYKSGRFDTARAEEESARILETYGGQVALYRRAAALVFGEEVRESYIYMTRTGTLVKAACENGY
ncbi:MAG: UvrD-helicase domain-containing protein, partial [Clostridiales Family XIII bacterium]|nr:UvrD-helicase domain-containing protein [Clostridiales Family XIII bacterium]